MKKDEFKDASSSSCGRCNKKIRMREDTHVVLCTATLGMIDESKRDVCEHYEECTEHDERLRSRQFY